MKSFTVCWVHQVCGEKFHDFFHRHLHTFMVFQLYKTATSVSTKASHSSREFSFKTVISILGNGREYITDKCMQISCFPGWPCSHRRRATVEVSSRWKRSLTTSLLASSVSYFLISWQNPRHLHGIFPRIFQNFSWCQLSAEQKFSRENFRGLLKICKNRESFLTVKPCRLRYFIVSIKKMN